MIPKINLKPCDRYIIFLSLQLDCKISQVSESYLYVRFVMTVILTLNGCASSGSKDKLGKLMMVTAALSDHTVKKDCEGPS